MHFSCSNCPQPHTVKDAHMIMCIWWHRHRSVILALESQCKSLITLCDHNARKRRNTILKNSLFEPSYKLLLRIIINLIILRKNHGCQLMWCSFPGDATYECVFYCNSWFSHLSVMWWHWWSPFLWVWDSSQKLHSGSRWWNCSWSLAAGRWPAP